MDLRGMRLDIMGATVKEDKPAIDVYSQAQATGTSSPWAGRAPVDELRGHEPECQCGLFSAAAGSGA